MDSVLKQDDADCQIEAIVHVLHLSKCYFDNFKIKGDRIKYWLLLNIILDASADELKVVKFREHPDVLKLMGEPTAWETAYRFKKLMRGFLNNRRKSYWSERVPEGGKKSDRLIYLNRNFDTSVSNYLDSIKEIVPSTNVPRLAVPEALTLFQAIRRFIRTDHRKAYDTLLEQLVSQTRVADPEAWKDNVFRDSSYWVIFLTAYRKYLGDPRVSVDLDEYEREVITFIGKPLLRPTLDILDELASEPVGILTTGGRRRSGKKVEDQLIEYTLTNQAIPALRAYASDLVKLQSRLPLVIDSVTAQLKAAKQNPSDSLASG